MADYKVLKKIPKSSCELKLLLIFALKSLLREIFII